MAIASELDKIRSNPIKEEVSAFRRLFESITGETISRNKPPNRIRTRTLFFGPKKVSGKLFEAPSSLSKLRGTKAPSPFATSEPPVSGHQRAERALPAHKVRLFTKA